MEKQIETSGVTEEKPDIWAKLPDNEATQEANQQEFEPTSAMTEESQPKPKGKMRRMLLVILGIIFVAGVTYATYYALHSMQVKNNGTAKTKVDTSKVQTAQKAASTSTDTAIGTSLDDIDSRITQSSTDQSDASAAISDSDQQVTVPTE